MARSNAFTPNTAARTLAALMILAKNDCFRSTRDSAA